MRVVEWWRTWGIFWQVGEIYFVDARDRSGGLISGWNKRVLNRSNSFLLRFGP